jgi:hypothetical protein
LVLGDKSTPNARRLSCEVRVRTSSGRRDHDISQAAACRYLDEMIVVLGDEAPELRQALERAKDEGP